MNFASHFRSKKRFLLLGIAAIALLGGWGLTRIASRNSGAIPPRAPLPKPNGFDLYVAAATALQQPVPPVDAINDRTKRTAQEAAKFYTSARRAAFVASNAKSWDLMARARAAQSLHPDTRDISLPSSDLMKPYGAMRELARSKTIQSKHFQDRKQWGLALGSGLDTLEMGRDIERGAPVIGSLVGMAITAVGAVSLEGLVPRLSAKDARNGAQRLEEIIRKGTPPAEVLREEKWSVLTNVRKGYGLPSGPLAKITAGPFSASIGPMMDDLIAQSHKPLASQIKTPAPKGFFNAMAGTLHPVFERYGFNAARREMHESGLLVRLGLRAYRAENGVYPAQLSQLAPQIIAKIPRDPFGRGETLRYRKNGDAYLAWSVGPDGKDNGGAPIPIQPGKKRVVVVEKSVGDIVLKP